MISEADTTGQVQGLRDASRALLPELDRLSADLQTEAHDLCADIRALRAERHTSAPPGARRVLVVDDERSVLRAMQRALITVVEQVDIAPSVKTAAAFAERNAYDVLVVDYQLANGTAKDLIARIRAASQRPLVWTILVSGWVDKHDGPALARDIGANRWLAKPLDLTALIDAVHEGLAASQRARAF